MAAIYDALGGRNWINTNWGNSPSIGARFGVTTGIYGQVVELDLRGNGLRGELPPEVGDLQHLTKLSLAGNELSGFIPKELGNLTKLEVIDLSQNRLRGEIPNELGNIASLESLYLSGNWLIGEIPSALGNLTNLHRLGLRSNFLRGEIPVELVLQLYNDSLEWLYLSDNSWSGCIPDALREVPKNDLDQLGLPFCEDGQ